jgi:hypothetical protein
MYKLQCFSVANGMVRSAGNDTFYQTYEEAEAKAKKYCADPSSYDDYVIYQAVARVRKTPPAPPPIEVISLITSPKSPWYPPLD